MSKTLGWSNVEIQKSEFVAKTQFRYDALNIDMGLSFCIHEMSSIILEWGATYMFSFLVLKVKGFNEVWCILTYFFGKRGDNIFF